MSEKKEGFLSSLFKGRKYEEAEREKNILQNMLDKKDRIISQLQEKLYFEEERRKKAEIFSKQADIIQKNLEKRDQKIKELLTSKEEFYLSEKKLKSTIDSLESRLEDSDKEKKSALEKYDDLMNIFNETHEENTALKEVHETLKAEIGNLNALKEKGDQMQIVGDVFLSRDALEEMQEEITSLKGICGHLREELDSRNTDLNLKESQVEDLKHRLKDALSADENKIKFRLPAELLFSSSKYDEVLKTLSSKDINFIDDIDSDTLREALEGCKNSKSAINLFKEYKDGHYNWDIKTFLTKGHKLSKIFLRQRKLLGYFNDSYMEFLVDLENFDFDTLSSAGFTPDQIESFKEKTREYDILKIQ